MNTDIDRHYCVSIAVFSLGFSFSLLFVDSCLMNTWPSSRKISPPLGEFSMSVLSTTGLTLMSSFTDRSIPFTEGMFLWIIVLWSLVRPSASKVLFCQYGRPMPLRIRVTACSWCSTLSPAFLDAIIHRKEWLCLLVSHLSVSATACAWAK